MTDVVGRIRSDAALVAGIRIAAGRHAVEPELVAAVVAQESHGIRSANRPERKWHLMWDVRRWDRFRPLTLAEIDSEAPPDDFHALTEDEFGSGTRTQEWWAQQMGLGLMQVQGATARWLGFRAPFLLELLFPDNALEYGCRYLAFLRARHPLEDAISAYNAGAPSEANADTYVKPVMAFLDTFRRVGLGS